MSAAQLAARSGGGLAVFAALLGAAPVLAVTDWLDEIDRALVVESPGGSFLSELSVLFDLEGYFVDERPPGLLFGGDGEFATPRLSLFLDTGAGRHLYSLVQARIDEGFDPRSDSTSARFDEYLIRYTPFDRPLVSVQVGKFATVVGNWVPRHDSWNNPLINAPLPYENVTIVSDAVVVPTPEAFLARRSVPDRKRIWQPVLWGPNYGSGASVFGGVGRFDYAAEVKNASPSSRPAEWDGRARDWEHPTASGRIGWTPHPAWALGASLSDGPYLRESTEPGLPAGSDAGDFRQTLAGADLRWAWRHWQLWSELYLSRFEVPNVGDADTLAWYVEGRTKLTSELFLGVRWNQQLFGEIDDSSGRDRAWDRDVWRLEGALAYRFDRHLQGKIQYGYMRQSGGFQQGEQLAAAQLTLSF